MPVFFPFLWQFTIEFSVRIRVSEDKRSKTIILIFSSSTASGIPGPLRKIILENHNFNVSFQNLKRLPSVDSAVYIITLI